eukprot:gene7864-8714_t
MASKFKAFTVARAIVTALFAFCVFVDAEQFRFNVKDDLQVGDFHVIKSKSIMADYLLKSAQVLKSNWRECWKHCFDTDSCNSFNFYPTRPDEYMCQPSTTKPHLEASKLKVSSGERAIWYFPVNIYK